MAATISFTCPECKTQLRGPAEMQGKKARCKRCSHIFVLKANAPAAPAAKGKPARPAGPPAKSSPAKPAAPKPAADDTDAMTYSFQEQDTDVMAGDSKGGAKPTSSHPQSNPYGVTDLDLAPRCPFCAQEMESEEAIICLHCGYNKQTRTLPAVKRTYANTPGEIFLWLLPGILCVLGFFGFGGVIAYLWMGLDPQNSKGTWYADIGAVQSLQVWGTIFSLGAMFFLARFAIKRLILHPTPPEVEKK